MEAAIRVRAASRFSACSGLPGLLQHLDQHALECRAFEPGGRRLDGNGARPERLHFKAIGFQFPGDGREGDHLRRQQVEQHGHEQPLALHLFHPALAQHPLEQHPLVRHMLIDDPKPSWFTARMKDSRSWPSGRSEARPCSEGLAARLPHCFACQLRRLPS